MGASAAHNREAPPAVVRAELVVQNGRLKGTTRRLAGPATFIGQAAGCDVRLNVDGISPMHCLVLCAGGNVTLRDLESASGTLVNGKRVSDCTLHHGDSIMIGPYHIQVQIHKEPPPAAPDDGRTAAEVVLTKERSALRLQVAAVAAQQAALGEAELKLAQREATLEKQQAQLAAHLEDKRRRLMELHAQTQAARQALAHDKQEYERRVEEVNADLNKEQRELLTRRQQAEAEKKRLVELRQRLMRRARRIQQLHRQRLARQAAELDEAAAHLEKDHARLEKQKAELAGNCVAYNTEMELGRRQLRDEWDRFHQEQKLVREFLSGRWADIQARESRLVAAEKLLDREKRQHSRRVEDLRLEAEGLDNRVRTGRRILAEVEATLQAVREAADLASQPRSEAGTPRIFPIAVAMPREWRLEHWLRAPAPTRRPVRNSPRPGKSRREAIVVLEDLADQRLALLDHWRQLAGLHGQWEQERQSLVGQMATVLTGLQTQAQALLARERSVGEAVEEVRARHRELLLFREHLVGWQGRLRAGEIELAAQHEQQQTAVAGREALVEKQLAAVVDLGQRWDEMGRQEVELWRAKQEPCERVCEEYLALNEERREQIRKLQDERRALTAKTLAIEQFRKECLARSGDAAASERRMQQLQKRWSVEESQALRHSKRECDNLRVELAQLRARATDLKAHFERLLNERQAFHQTRGAWERERLRQQMADAQLRAQLRSALTQRDQLQQRLGEMNHELERIAREILVGVPAPAVLQDATSESELPTVISMEKAA